jgi:hypothetical protein
MNQAYDLMGSYEFNGHKILTNRHVQRTRVCFSGYLSGFEVALIIGFDLASPLWLKKLSRIIQKHFPRNFRSYR